MRRIKAGLVLIVLITSLAGPSASLGSVAAGQPQSGTSSPLALLGSQPLTDPTGIEPDQPCHGDLGQIDHAIDLRAAIGLPSDRDTVTTSFEDTDYVCSSDFGIPLSELEIAESWRVMEAQTDEAALVDSMATDPAFGGAYFDGPVLTIASTTGTLGAGLVLENGNVRLVKAQFAQVALDGIASKIADRTRMPDSGNKLDIRMVNANPRLNRVEVAVASDLLEAQQELGAQFGDAVVVTAAADLAGGLLACNVYDCGTRGGVAINHFGPWERCTSGFLVRARLAGTSTWARYILTAGHCVDHAGGPSNSNKWRNGAGNTTSDPYTIEWAKNKYQDFWPWSCGFLGLASCLQGDLGLINLNGQSPSSWNTYMTGSSWRSITGSKTRSQQVVGQIVCRHGRTSGLDCGQISGKADQVTLNFGTENYFGTVQVSLASAGGDSGSGFYRVPYSGDYADAYGILSAGSGGLTLYWPIQPFYKSPDFCDAVEVQVCASSSCPL